MTDVYRNLFDTPVGKLVAITSSTHLLLLDYVRRDDVEKRIARVVRNVKNARIVYEPHELSDEVGRQLGSYFCGNTRAFSLPLSVSGTSFQKDVWGVLKEIQYGHTQTYGQIADRVGRKGAARAVGQANNANPCVIVIPCHRVVGSAKASGGYSVGLETRNFLLELEGAD